MIKPHHQKKQAKKNQGTLTVAFGRFNPPTIGHEKLLNAAGSQAKGGEYKIYPSRSQDAKKNPSHRMKRSRT